MKPRKIEGIMGFKKETKETLKHLCERMDVVSAGLHNGSVRNGEVRECLEDFDERLNELDERDEDKILSLEIKANGLQASIDHLTYRIKKLELHAWAADEVLKYNEKKDYEVVKKGATSCGLEGLMASKIDIYENGYEERIKELQEKGFYLLKTYDKDPSLELWVKR